MSIRIKNILAILFWIIIWEISSRLVNLELLLPSPLSTLKALFILIRTKDFYLSVIFTVVRVLAGFILGIIFGSILAVLSYIFENLKILFSPLIRGIHVIPVASFIVLLLVWVNNSIVPVITGMLIVIPISFNNVYTGLINIDKDLLNAAKLFNISKLDQIRFLYLKELKGYIYSAVTASLGMAFKATIAAEVIAASRFSLGRGISQSKMYLETSNLFAYTFTVLLISILIEKIIKKVMEKLADD